MAGLAPATMRQVVPVANDPGDDIIVEIEENGPDQPIFSDDGKVLEIEHGDGSLTISMDGKPLNEPDEDKSDKGWFAELSDKIEDTELSRIADDLLRGIDDDLSEISFVKSDTTRWMTIGDLAQFRANVKRASVCGR